MSANRYRVTETAVVYIVVAFLTAALFGSLAMFAPKPHATDSTPTVSAAPPADLTKCDASQPMTEAYPLSTRPYKKGQAVFYSVAACFGEETDVWLAFMPRGSQEYLLFCDGPILEWSDMDMKAMPYGTGMSGRIRIAPGYMQPGPYDLVLLSADGWASMEIRHHSPPRESRDPTTMPALKSGVKILYRSPVAVTV